MEWTYQAFGLHHGCFTELAFWWSRLREWILRNFLLDSERSLDINLNGLRVGKINTSTIKSILRLLTRQREWMTLTFDAAEKWRWDRRLVCDFQKDDAEAFSGAQLSRWSYRGCCCWGSNDLFGKENNFIVSWNELRWGTCCIHIGCVDVGQWFSTFLMRYFLLKFLRNLNYLKKLILDFH